MTVTTEIPETVLVCVPICQGIAIGKPYFLIRQEDTIPEYSIPSQEIDSELERYRNALENTRNEIRILQKQLEKERILEGAAILEAHLQIMHDPLITSLVEKEIRSTKKNAVYVFHKHIKAYQKRFNTMGDPFFRERFKDIQDISQRVMAHLRSTVRFALKDIPPNSVIFAATLSATDTAEANIGCVEAFVSMSGGAASHAAIVAKARGIPYVSSVDFESYDIHAIHNVIVDGTNGEVIINPSARTIERYQRQKGKLEEQFHKLTKVSNYPAETYDGYEVRLSANIDSIHEIKLVHDYGANGVGLFRSELMFLNQGCFPSEEDQYQIYREIVDRMDGFPIVIRTFDLGGDKYIRQDTFPQETNPFLGCRAIRFLLRERELFKMQLRAILRASARGDVSVMFPMVTSLFELIEAKKIVKEAELELRQKKVPFNERIPIGCMIEVPSAAIIADLLAKECDFLSIGTNDLVQYALAVDRDNHFMSHMYLPSDPSVIRLIKLVVTEANKQQIPVTVCGEIAADPRYTALLVGLGVQQLSVAARYLPLVKNAIRSISVIDAHRLAEEALTLTSADAISQLLESYFYQHIR